MPGVELVYRALRLCSSGGGYEALPAARVELDLPEIRDRLTEAGATVTDARVMLIVAGAPEITVGRTGRVLVKARDRASADAALNRFFERAGLRVRVVEDGRSPTG